MPIPATAFIWFNGKLVPWERATVHVLAHALHYGSSVFEGVRAYATPRGVAIFRLKDHTRRLFDSAKIYRLQIPFTPEQINDACHQVVANNDLSKGAYLRPIALRGYGEIGVAPKVDPPVDVAVAAWEWGKYLGHESEAAGVDVCVSSWQRVAPNTLPALAKAAGNYLSSQLISMEAKRLGFAEGIGLAPDGTVQRRRRREPLPGQGWHPLYTGTCAFGAGRHHARHRHEAGCPGRPHRARELHSARAAVPGRRAVLYRHGRGNYADPLRRPHFRSVPVSAARSPNACSRPFSALFSGGTADTWHWLDFVDMQRQARTATA